MKLYIDNKEVEMDSDSAPSVSLSIASVTTPEYGRTGYSKSIRVPATVRNMAIMGDCHQIHARERFNTELHTAYIEEDGFIILEGTVMLVSCELYGNACGYYRLNIIGSGKLWARHASAHSYSSLFPDYSATITGQTIAESWTGDSSVKLLPVLRDAHQPANSSVSLSPSERFLTAADYHPFINLRATVEAIFADAGYGVCSDFLSSDFFSSLYMSGRFISRDVSVVKERMDFLARRFSAVSASANDDGKVFADPNLSYNTIGNIVDTADPKESREGIILDDVFSNNGCFASDGGRIVFTPLHEISLGFEYRLKYVTDYRISDSERLDGFCEIYLGNDDLRSHRLVNTFQDRRGQFRAGKTFRCIVANHIDGRQYRLDAWRITNPEADPGSLAPGDYENVTVGYFNERSGLVSTSVEGVFTNVRLLFKTASATAYRNFTGDWMLYDGYVAETGQVEVEVMLRSKPEIVSPSSPKYFDDIYFAGAAPGMEFTLLSAQVRPVFLGQPTEGSMIGFAEIGALGVSRIEVVNALRQMFNLYFYTDNLGKKVYIEPRGSFYGGTVVDWSGKMDFSKPYSLEEIAASMPGSFRLAYVGGDGAVSRYNASVGCDFGEWSAELSNPYSTVVETTYLNPLFSASLNVTDSYGPAPSASWLQVGDRDNGGDIYRDDLNFQPKVVRYSGMKPLPEGQRWGWPSYGNSFPSLAFHDPSGEGFTLCFDDTDGITGLHTYWDDTVATYRHGLRLTAWIRLTPCDIEPFIVPNRLQRDFRALYLLRIDGELSYWRLEEICDYNPNANSTKCVFFKQM